MKPLTKSAVILVIAVVTAYLTVYPACAQVLRTGMRGEEVRALQERLVRLGHDLAVDGIFGRETESVVLQIQELAGISADGIVGRQTQEVLRILEESVFVYTVQRGDTLSDLAFAYGTTVNQIMRRNGLDDPDQLYAGQRLLIPNISQAAFSGARRTPRVSFVWPVQGRITSGFGWRNHPITRVRHFHAGIDIAAPHGTPIRAAAAGRVVSAGRMGAYGLAVVIDHGSGYTTWYGHCSKLLVRAGDSVKSGQQIALVGSTGHSTGPHLDFRIKIGEYAVNPLEILP